MFCSRDRDALLGASQPVLMSQSEEVWKLFYDCGSAALSKSDDACIKRALDREVSPPAFRFILAGLAIIWAFFFLCPVVAYALSSCSGPGLAEASLWIWAIYFPIVASTCFCEIAGYRYILPLHLQRIGPPTVCGKPLSYPMWFCLYGGLSLLAHLDIATSGIAVGRLLATSTCHESLVDRVWAVAYLHSPVLRLMPSLPVLAMVSWALMLPQLVFALFHGLPTGELEENGQKTWTMWELLRCKKVEEIHSPDSFFARVCMTRIAGRITVLQAAEALGEAGRMALFSARSVTQITTVLGEGLSHGKARIMWVARIQRMAFRAAAYLLLETSISLRLQAAVLATAKAAGGGGLAANDLLTAASILMSAGMGMCRLVIDAISLKEMCCAVKPHIGKDDLRGGYNAKRKKIAVHGAIALFLVAALATIALLVDTLINTFETTAVCYYGPWDLSGCMNVTGIVNVSRFVPAAEGATRWQ